MLVCLIIIISVRPEREFWPEPDCYNLAGTGTVSTSLKLTGFLTGVGISNSVVLSNTIICNFQSKISHYLIAIGPSISWDLHKELLLAGNY